MRWWPRHISIRVFTQLQKCWRQHTSLLPTHASGMHDWTGGHHVLSSVCSPLFHVFFFFHACDIYCLWTYELGASAHLRPLYSMLWCDVRSLWTCRENAQEFAARRTKTDGMCLLHGLFQRVRNTPFFSHIFLAQLCLFNKCYYFSFEKNFWRDLCLPSQLIMLYFLFWYLFFPSVLLISFFPPICCLPSTLPQVPTGLRLYGKVAKNKNSAIHCQRWRHQQQKFQTLPRTLLRNVKSLLWSHFW